MSVNKKNIQIGLGISSVLMVFVVLCMTFLSVLTYRDANQKMSITLRQQAFQQQYMTADANMQFLLAEISKTSYTSISQIIEDKQILQKSEQLGITLQMEEDICILYTSLYNEQVLRVTFQLEAMKPYILTYQTTM